MGNVVTTSAARSGVRQLPQMPVRMLQLPVPLPMFSFTGSRGSILGDINFYGKGGVQFYTQWKTVTSNWKLEEEEELSLAMPIL